MKPPRPRPKSITRLGSGTAPTVPVTVGVPVNGLPDPPALVVADTIDWVVPIAGTK